VRAFAAPTAEQEAPSARQGAHPRQEALRSPRMTGVVVGASTRSASTVTAKVA